MKNRKNLAVQVPKNTVELPLMPDNFRISPEERLCPAYDYQSIAAYRVASRRTMGFRVIDDCVQEHIM